MKRKSISKATREQVYAKYGGRCAYCGCHLEMNEMQVDHVDSVYRADYEGRVASNEIDNLMPACRQCNFYKGTSTIDEFREKIARLYHSVQIGFPVRLAKKYGIVSLREWDKLFHFERMSLTEEVKKVIDEIERNNEVRNQDLLQLTKLGVPALEMWKDSRFVWYCFLGLLREKYSL